MDGFSGGVEPQLATDGWCVIPDVLSRDEAAHVLERVWAVAEANDRAGIPTSMPEIDPGGRNVRVLNLIEGDPLFRELIRHPRALEMVGAVIGSHFMVSNFTANIALPGSASMPLHSDQSFVAPEPWSEPWACNIIWCLTDVCFENGATLFIPGSHRWRTRDDVPPDALTRLRPFEARAGSFVVMEGRMWHTSGANVTADQERACLFGYYSASFLRPQVNWNVALSPAVQASLEPQMRDMLGLGLLPKLPPTFTIERGLGGWREGASAVA